MSACDVEPLDLSRDTKHDVYEQQFEKITASEDMRKKMEELAKEMSHFSYKDLWTECCRRYKDIVKRLLGYEVHSQLMKSGIVPESADDENCRKRKSSDDSNDSGLSECSSLPLKKRHLRCTYRDSEDVFDTKGSVCESTTVLEERKGTDQVTPPPPSVHYVDGYRDAPGETSYGQLTCENLPTYPYYGCCTQQTAPPNDLPCDLSISSNSDIKSAIPSLTRYDNSALSLMSGEQNRGLLARLLTEPQLPPPISLKNPPQDREYQKTTKVSVSIGHISGAQGANSCNRPVIVNRNIYSSPYLSASGHCANYSAPTRSMASPSEIVPSAHSKVYVAHASTSTVDLKNSKAANQITNEQVHHNNDTVSRCHPDFSTSRRRPKPLNVRENRRDKILKRLLQYSPAISENYTEPDRNKANDSNDLDNESYIGPNLATSFWEVIENACEKMAAL